MHSGDAGGQLGTGSLFGTLGGQDCRFRFGDPVGVAEGLDFRGQFPPLLLLGGV